MVGKMIYYDRREWTGKGGQKRQDMMIISLT